MSDLVMSDTQEADLSVAFTDAKGNPTTDIGGAAPAWAVSDEALLGLTVADGGMSATVKAAAGTGSGSVTVDVTNDQGTQITGAISVTILAGDAVAAEVAASEPREQTA